MRFLLTTTALVAMAAAPTFAQDDSTETADPAAGEAQSTEMAGTETSGGGDFASDFLASDLIGRAVYATPGEVDSGTEMTEAGEDWQRIGEIGDLLLAREGGVDGVLLDIGGFLGIGEHRVALQMDRLNLINDADAEGEYFVVVQATEEQLNNAPAFDTAGLANWAGQTVDPAGQAQQDQAAGEAGGMTAAESDMAEGGAPGDAPMADGEEAGGDMAATGDAEQPMENAADDAAQETAEAADEAEQATENAGEDVAAVAEDAEQSVEGAAEEAESEVAEAGQDAEQAVEGAADEAEAEVREAGRDAEQSVEGSETEMASGDASAEQPAESDTDMAASDAATEEQPSEGETDMAVSDTGSEEQPAEGATDMASTDAAGEDGGSLSITRDGFQQAAAGDISVDTLTGARVYDVNDEWIGEVSDILMSDDGQAESAVLDIGGFLGFGEKSVAMNFEALNIQTQTEGDEVRVYVDATKEDFDAMENYSAEN